MLHLQVCKDMMSWSRRCGHTVTQGEVATRFRVTSECTPTRNLTRRRDLICLFSIMTRSVLSAEHTRKPDGLVDETCRQHETYLLSQSVSCSRRLAYPMPADFLPRCLLEFRLDGGTASGTSTEPQVRAVQLDDAVHIDLD